MHALYSIKYDMIIFLSNFGKEKATKIFVHFKISLFILKHFKSFFIFLKSSVGFAPKLRMQLVSRQVRGRNEAHTHRKSDDN